MSGGPVFMAPFSAVALTTNPYDLFHITAPSNARVSLREIRLGQYTEFGDAQAELLSLQVMVGTTAASTGTAITPNNVLRHTGAPTAATSIVGPSTALASTASATVMISDAWNVEAGYWLSPADCDRIVLNPGQRAIVRMTAPNDTLTLNGTLMFQEMGSPRL